jgi:hypothetical protein
VRREALCRIPGAAGKNSKEVLGSNGFTRIRKVNGTIACQESGGQVQVPGLRRRGTRVIWRRLDCLIAQSPADARIPSVGKASETGVTSCGGIVSLLSHLRGVERCPARAIKEISGTPTSRSTRTTGMNAGSPTGREPHGDGVPVVVVGVATHQGGRESRPQGEGAQVAGHRSAGRYA